MKKAKGINPEVEAAINLLLKEVMNDPSASITDKTRIIDRALNLEKIKARFEDEAWGSGFASLDDVE